MSYILDALRKSESERQQQHLPGFADIPNARRPKSTPVWIWLLSALLLVNAAVLAVLLLDKEPAAGEKQVSLPLPVAGTDDQPSFREVVNEAREQVPAPQTAAPVAATPPPVTAVRNSRTPATPVTAPREAPPREPPASTQQATPRPVPSLMELQASGALQLPDLHLDIHVYSQNPADRFVFINMTKYREQARLTEGPLIKEIRSDGVLLEHRDREFILYRE
jgi:general secretion pathway protein B